MRVYYQIYRSGMWFTSTTSKEEAERIARELIEKGYTVEVKIK